MSIAIVVHGGAGIISPNRIEIAQTGCKEAALLGWRILQEGGSALDAVEATVKALEDNPNYNAGIGSCLTNTGTIEMDAGLMEGHTLRVGAVAGVELVKNPIMLARKVLESPHVLLVGQGAQHFALEQGMSLCTYEDLLTERQYDNWQRRRAIQQEEQDEPRYHRREIASRAARDERGRIIPPAQAKGEGAEKHGTVGAVALDDFGTLAAATSTGGIPNKYPGRIGDSPLVGSGFYADDQAAISCTGYGEDFIRLLIAKRAADYAAHGATARDAAQATIALLGAKAAGTGGLIIVDRLGNVGFAWNSQHMVYAYLSQGMDTPITGV